MSENKLGLKSQFSVAHCTLNIFAVVCNCNCNLRLFVTVITKFH